MDFLHKHTSSIFNKELVCISVLMCLQLNTELQLKSDEVHYSEVKLFQILKLYYIKFVDFSELNQAKDKHRLLHTEENRFFESCLKSN